MECRISCMTMPQIAPIGCCKFLYVIRLLGFAPLTYRQTFLCEGLQETSDENSPPSCALYLVAVSHTALQGEE
jgi:hypothetical protein